MLTDFVRDHAFTVAWFGLMAFVWFGWSQEDPPSHWRWRLGVGSIIGVIFAGAFGYAVALRWDDGSALDGRYAWFGLLVLVEVALAGAGSLYLWRKRQTRWIAWWVAFVVALHFIPLAFLLEDASLVLLGLVQVVALGVIARYLCASHVPTSRLVGPVMGASLLVFGTISAVMFVVGEGSPW